MKSHLKRLAGTLALILLTFLASILFISPPNADADPSAGTIIWKDVCPWRATVVLRQDGRDVVVECSTTR